MESMTSVPCTANDHFPPILTVKQAAAMTGMSVAWFDDGRWRGSGPPYLRIARRAIRYDREALLSWFRAKEVRPGDMAT